MKGSKTRILHITNACTIGGAEQHLLILLSALQKTGKYTIDLAFFRERPDAADSMVNSFKKDGINIIDLNAKGKFPLATILKLKKIMKKNKYDLVHTHLFKSEFIGSLAARLAGIKNIVSTVHNMEHFYRNPLIARIARIIAKKIDTYIAISRAVKDYFIKYVRIEPNKMQTILYGYEPADSPTAKGNIRQEFHLTDSQPYLLSIARLAPQKGYQYLIKAMLDVRQKFPKAKLLIVGHDEKGTRSKLLAQITKLGLAEQVVLAGFRSDTQALLAEADLFILPSLWEGFGLVLLEAMHAKKAIVATKVGPVPEIVEDGKTGLLVPPADSTALASAIIKVLQDPSLKNTLAANGLKRVKEVFSVQAMVRQTENIYAKLLKKR